MATKNYLDKTGLAYFWSKIVAKIPTKTSDLTNDSGFALDSDVVHKTGAETITGEKTFSATKVKVLNGETVFNYSAERRWDALSIGTAYANWEEAKKDGTWHRIWRISFPANTNFWGRLTIGLTASYAGFNASGYMEKQISIAFNGAALYNNVGHYSALSIKTEKDFRISECIWNADTSQWQIIIYSQQPQGNNAPRSVILKCETYADYLLTAFDGITIESTPEISQIASYTNTSATPSGGTKTFYFADLPVYQDPYGREILNTDSVASATKLGGIKVGSGLSITDGVLSTQPTAPNWSDITNKPAFATVATSGSYNDLTNKPTIPTAGTITSGSTGYATGGDVYNAIGDVESILTTLNNGGGAQ